MPAIAVVGAGPGLGLSIAKRFGREGFVVGLISRTQKNLDPLTAELNAAGIMAAGFAADVTTTALGGVPHRLAQQSLHPVRRTVAGLLSQLPTRSGFHIGQQAQ
jgi:short-subunit dehydrogenase